MMKKKLAKWIVVILFLPVLTRAATVTRILDGDTLEVTEDNKTLRVRLIDIDAPEKKQPYGQKAKQFLTDFVKDADAVAVKNMGTDRYGRTLAQVYVKKCERECLSYLVNAEMVRNGYAWAYRYHNVPSSKAMEYEESEARKNRLGLWHDNEAIEPWKWRQLHNQHKE